MEIDIIKKIVKASGVTQGELILIHFWGEDSDIDLMHKFAVAVAELGAASLELQQSRTHNCNLFRAATKTTPNEKYYSIFKEIDAVLDIFTYKPVVLNCTLQNEQMDCYRDYMKNIFQVFMKKERFTQIRIPTAENAKETGLEPSEFIERMTKAYDIDYDKLKVSCEKKITELKEAEEILIHTGDNCTLSIITKSRDWIADCGDGDWPCGEVYIAPIEEKTKGTIFYSKLYLGDIGEFENVTLTIKEGVIINSNSELINQFLKQNPKENLTVCELGFGCNENIVSAAGYAVLDEKMIGSFHIAIGDNSMFGGKNRADLHIDLVGTATVELKHTIA